MHLTSIGNGNILLEPGSGLDPGNPDIYLEPLMGYMQSQNAVRLIYDLKDTPFIDPIYYQWLIKLNRVCQVCNIKMVVTNMRPTAAFALAAYVNKSPPFLCALTVEHARELA